MRRCHALALFLGGAYCAAVSPVRGEDAHLARLTDDELIAQGHGHLREGSARGALYYLGAALARRRGDLELARTVVTLHQELCHLDESLALAESALSQAPRPEDAELRTELEFLVAEIKAGSRELTVSFVHAIPGENDASTLTADAALFVAVEPATQPPGCPEELDRRLRHHLGAAAAGELPPTLKLRVPLGDFVVGDHAVAVRAPDPHAAVQLALPAADTGVSVWLLTAGGVALVGGAVVAVTLLSREAPPARIPDTFTLEVTPR